MGSFLSFHPCGFTYTLQSYMTYDKRRWQFFNTCCGDYPLAKFGADIYSIRVAFYFLPLKKQPPTLQSFYFYVIRFSNFHLHQIWWNSLTFYHNPWLFLCNLFLAFNKITFPPKGSFFSSNIQLAHAVYFHFKGQ